MHGSKITSTGDIFINILKLAVNIHFPFIIANIINLSTEGCLPDKLKLTEGSPIF